MVTRATKAKIICKGCGEWIIIDYHGLGNLPTIQDDNFEVLTMSNDGTIFTWFLRCKNCSNAPSPIVTTTPSATNPCTHEPTPTRPFKVEVLETVEE